MEGGQLSSSQSQKLMNSLVEKLCDHLSSEKVKQLIDNGFDEWQTITFMKGDELVQLGFTAEECIVVMLAVNSNAKEFHQPPVFPEPTIKQVIEKAKLNEQSLLQSIQKDRISPKDEREFYNELPQLPELPELPVYPDKPITEGLLMKGIAIKAKPNQKIVLSKITLITLDEKEITRIESLDKVPSLQNLYLSRNRIKCIEGLSTLTKVKILRLDNNLITRIENLDSLELLERLELNDNYICKLGNLANNRSLNYLNLSNQKSHREFVFDEDTCVQLGYCLDVLDCNASRVADIGNLRHLRSVRELRLKSNLLKQIGELSDALTGMERLLCLDLRGNPLAAVPKYRDYIVILSKSLEELDDKKILPTERQYLVKLYSLKHAKQQKEESSASQKEIKPQKMAELHVTKMEEGTGPRQYAHGADLRGNVPHINTKVIRK